MSHSMDVTQIQGKNRVLIGITRTNIVDLKVPGKAADI